MSLLGPAPLRVPIGISDYLELRRGGFCYVDKTGFVAEILASVAKVTLFPRPRRFGKTLNMSTLRAFLERGGGDEVAAAFADTSVWVQDGGAFKAHFQRYPVIWLTFKDVKARTWEDTWSDLRLRLIAEVERLIARGDLDRERLSDSERSYLDRLTDPSAPPSSFRLMLWQLVGWLSRTTGERVVILIDEYDAPLHAAWEHGYWTEAIDFFRAFLAAGLKDEANLFRGVLTGILKVAKENIFSGLNNIRSHSMLQSTAADHFGFTEPEVLALAERAGAADSIGGLREWYDGYRFGGTRPVTLYNPWSILSFLADPGAGFQSFWMNTSSNALIHELLLLRAAEVGPDIAALVSGGTVTRVLDENVPLQLVRDVPDALWSLLTFSGYLTPESVAQTDGGLLATLRIPNREVAAIFRSTFERFLARAAPSSGGVSALVVAMLRGDVDELAERLEDLLVTAMSIHDFGAKPVEAIYQAFIVGLLVHVDATHRVVSNREAGFGRADVLVIPRSPGPGAVLELKVVGRQETAEKALERAVTQLEDRDYAAEVRAAGATAVHQYAVVFDGKRSWLRAL